MSDDETTEGLRVAVSALRETVDRQVLRMDDFLARFDPIEAHILDEQKKAEVDALAAAQVEERMRRMGLVVPPEGIDGETTLTTGTGVSVQRRGWLWDGAALLGTDGARRALGTIALMWVTAWLGPEAGHALTAWLTQGPAAIEATTTPDIDQGPPEVPVETLDSPVAPRPSL